MSFYHVEEDYQITHTNHYFVEAPTLDAAVEEIKNGSHKPQAITEAKASGDCEYGDTIEINRNIFSHTPIIATAKGSRYRSLRTIAKEVSSDWKKVYFGAVPYLAAMFTLDKITDTYFHDSAEEVVMYFLANAQTWRGEVARRVKSELNAMLDNG